MGKFSNVYLKLPDIKKSYVAGSYNYSDSDVKADNIATIKEIDKNYGTLIKKWSTLFEIPYGVVVGFIATESGGKMVKPNRYLATGLMQMTPASLYDSVTKWSSEVKEPLPKEAVSLLNQKVPELMRKAPFTSSLKNKILTNLTNDANFNIMAGCISLRWLLERFSTPLSGSQLNKAMVSYNAGAYTRALVIGGGTKPNVIPIDSTVLANNIRVPSESRAYLYKMLGKDGFLSLIFQQNVI